VLVQACRSGHAPALESAHRELFERYSARVFTICQDLTGNTQDACDATQDTFAIVFRRLDTFRFESRFSSWLYKIATNAAIDIRRSARLKRPLSLDRLLESKDDPSARGLSLPDERCAEPSDPPTQRERNADVHRAIRGLSEKLREVVLLRYFEDLAYEEIGRRLGVSVGTVKSRLFRAHEALQYWLAPAMARHTA
jgi:RNA polymerase sigma-70 factor (ECF subfamily)